MPAREDVNAPVDATTKVRPLEPEAAQRMPAIMGATFAERRAARLAAENKGRPSEVESKGR